MDRLVLVMPAYNEEANIRQVLEDWLPVVEAVSPESRLLLVDDGSRDDTLAVACTVAQDHPALIPVTQPNQGHGAAVLNGYRRALEMGADYVFQTDSDGQTLPSEFSAFWEQRRKYAMVIGLRRGRQDGFGRVVVTKTLRLTLLFSFGVRVPDANTPFRLMEAGELARLLPKVPDGYNLTNVLLSVLYVRNRLPVKWIPITFRPRQGGVNSLNWKRIFAIGRQALGDFRRLRKTVREG